MLAHTKKLTEVAAANFDAVFYPGGHGPLWDLANDKQSINLIESFWKSKKPVATVCHAPSVLLHVKDEKGHALVKGKKLPAFQIQEQQQLS